MTEAAKQLHRVSAYLERWADEPECGEMYELVQSVLSALEAIPDMLEALNAAQAALSDGGFQGLLVDSALRQIDAALSGAARTALAQARKG